MTKLRETSAATLEYMVNGIRYVCENYKKRSPGSQSERDAQEFFRDELKKYSDKVIMEDFDLHPNAFMGFIPIAAVFGVISTVLYWFTEKTVAAPIIGLVLMILAVAMFVVEFMMYRKMVDFIFPKKVSRNVYATRAPSGELKRRIIFGGHADAANEWTYSYHGGIKALGPVIFGAVLGMFYVAIVDLILVIKTFVSEAPVMTEGTWKVLGMIMICFVPFFVAIMFFINWGLVVDGANDNLSACYIAIAVLKEMEEKGFRFENTEVGCLITGSEEAGLRGAQAFAKKHKAAGDGLITDVETIYISMDTMREIEQLQVYTMGCTGTVRSSEPVGDLLREAGLNCGVDMPRAALYPGAVDSDGFAQHGLTAAGFCGVNHDPKKYYHTREDTVDNISPECIDISLKICMEAAELYDKNGGIAKYGEKYNK